MSTVGIIQSNFLPWRGYFDFIYEVDNFVILEDVQYTKRDWRNRNKLKSRDGKTHWLSVPVLAKRETKINEAIIDNSQDWSNKVLGFLEHNYSKAPFYKDYISQFKHILESGDRLLVDLNFKLIHFICSCLEINTTLIRSSELNSAGSKEQKLINLVELLDGRKYLSGPAAKDYIKDKNWLDSNIELAYKNYNGYPDYPQISEPFSPGVSILDLLFMKGNKAPEYIWGKYRSFQ